MRNNQQVIVGAMAHIVEFVFSTCNLWGLVNPRKHRKMLKEHLEVLQKGINYESMAEILKGICSKLTHNGQLELSSMLGELVNTDFEDIVLKSKLLSICNHAAYLISVHRIKKAGMERKLLEKDLKKELKEWREGINSWDQEAIIEEALLKYRCPDRACPEIDEQLLPVVLPQLPVLPSFVPSFEG